MRVTTSYRVSCILAPAELQAVSTILIPNQVAAATNAPRAAELMERAAARLKASDRSFQKYLSLSSVVGSDLEVKEVTSKRNALGKVIVDLRAAVEAHDQSSVIESSQESMPLAFRSMDDAMQKLQKLDLVETRESSESAVHAFELSRGIVVGSVLLGLVAAAWTWFLCVEP
ncbi:Tar ligand binding domain-containing protein [Paraburkholderia sediminicola]|uniref:Tar ligand binding domain-containing protein n=1 Tax=Paraburkholderia sediminicola TaxID=458836 RepID=UPI0038BB4108